MRDFATCYDRLGSDSVIPVMSAARPLFPRKRKFIRDLAMSHMCHVWTAPSWQGFSSRLQVGRCSHVFGLFVRFT
jgi:hypothetical protein